MSSPISIPGAPSFEAIPIAGRYWRIVEAQHHVSTLKLVDSTEEQAVLEDIIEATKPVIPPECRHLHWLLATPFRYAPYPRGSRFRRAGHAPGVFYCSEAMETAIAEAAFYRLLFFAESPGTPWPMDAGQYTGFAVEARARRGIDLTQPPWSKRRADWTDPVDYTACQALADDIRGAGIEAIRYESVRDPRGGANVALLSCATFARAEPVMDRTWRIRLSPFGIQAVCEMPKLRLDFTRETFATDPRVATLKWDRPLSR